MPYLGFVRFGSIRHVPLGARANPARCCPYRDSRKGSRTLRDLCRQVGSRQGPHDRDRLLRDLTAAGVSWRLTSGPLRLRSEEHTSELQSLMRISYAVFCLKHKNTTNPTI